MEMVIQKKKNGKPLKDPHRRLTRIINDIGYIISYRIEAKIGPYTIATARLTSGDGHANIVGFGISRCSKNDQWNDAIGEQVAIGRAMVAALYKAVDPNDDSGPLHLISVLMA